MEEYLRLLRRAAEEGNWKDNRTGVRTKSVSFDTFTHDPTEGYPLLTTKKMAWVSMKTELYAFIHAITDKGWLQERGCHIWGEWSRRDIIPEGLTDEAEKEFMARERDLGSIYGFQWRHFGAVYRGYDVDYAGEGVDQLENLVNTIKTDPGNRRMMVMAWNPIEIEANRMALPPCHYGFQVLINDCKLDFKWDQRSVDTPLGLPFNVASYALLQHLLCLETGYEPGILVGDLGDVHIYENQLSIIGTQLEREPLALPTIETPKFTSLFDWKPRDTKLKGYESHDRLSYPIAV